MSDDMVPAPVFSVRMVGELKGAPLACLILLAMSSQPVSNEWLCMMSGYTDKPIALALKKLSSPEFQMVRKAFGGWMINSIAQLPFELSDISRNNSVPTTTILINKDINTTELVVAGRKISDSALYNLNMDACKAAGIGEPSASRLSLMEHVTPDFIKAHVDDLKKGETRGLAILRIEGNELPASWQANAKAQSEQEVSNWRYSHGMFMVSEDAGGGEEVSE